MAISASIFGIENRQILLDITITLMHIYGTVTVSNSDLAVR